MINIIEQKEIPIDDLVIGQGQARTDEPGKGIDELAFSIDAIGLLQPIVVCKSDQEGKWEILAGQRRFLAHKLLQRETIMATVIDGSVGNAEAKTISVTENLVRRKLSNKEVKDAITHLYKIYGTIKDVVKSTGFPYRIVRDNVKYPRLIQELKDLVDKQEVDINSAVSAQDATTEGDKTNVEDAVQLAREMNPMIRAQRQKAVKDRKENPEKPVKEVIEDAKSGTKINQIVVTVSEDTHNAIKKHASNNKISPEEASSDLIEKALSQIYN